MKLHVPDELDRNAPHVRAAGPEVTGRRVLEHITKRLGLTSLADVDILDIGCGVRFTQTIVNCGLPVRSYTGVEVDKRIVDFLNENVASGDPRFRFYHWNARNQMYNPAGEPLGQFSSARPAESFDLITLYSVLTHLTVEDAACMLEISRERMRLSGKLFFSAFVDDTRSGWRDGDPENPLLMSVFGAELIEGLIVGAGWQIDLWDDTEVPEPFAVRHYLCSPR